MRLMQTLYTRNFEFHQWNKRSIPFVDEKSASTFLEGSSRKPKPKAFYHLIKQVKIKVSNNCDIQTPLR